MIVLAAAIGTTALMVYAARPWGDNYAYQDISGYLLLLGFGLWGILPYIGFTALIRKTSDDRPISLTILIGTTVICFGSLALIIDSMFLHVDAQGGLVFVVVPVYQWVSLGLLGVLQYLIKTRLERSARARSREYEFFSLHGCLHSAPTNTR